MGTQTTRPAQQPEKEKDEKPKKERLPASADVPEDNTEMEPPPKSWPG